MKYTEEQKSKLRTHIAFNSHVYTGESVKRWFDDEEIVRFTKTDCSYNNAKFEINNNPNHEIWFSQLNHLGLDDDMTLNSGDLILKDGKQLLIHNMSVYDFWTSVEGKQFKVDIYINIPFAFNMKSILWKQKPLRTIGSAIEFINQCVDNNKIEDIGDLLKMSKLYRLTEI